MIKVFIDEGENNFMAKLKYPPRKVSIIAKMMRGLKSLMNIHGAVTSPISTFLNKGLDIFSDIDNPKRIGNIKGRSQYLDRKRNSWIKIDSSTGKEISVKQSPGPYKNVKKRKNAPKIGGK